MPASRLSPGRHGLSREQVTDSQRTRMLLGMADAVAEKGYASVTVADVLDRAEVSRETFYEQFSNKGDCFLAAYDAAVATIHAELDQPRSPGKVGGDPIAQLDRFVERYLGALAREPALARTFLVEIHAAGPEAVRRRTEVWTRAIDAIADLLGAEDGRRRFACAAIFYAIVGLATQRVGEGRIDELPGERGALMGFARATFASIGAGVPP